jgi:hypothetical protein
MEHNNMYPVRAVALPRGSYAAYILAFFTIAMFAFASLAHAQGSETGVSVGAGASGATGGAQIGLEVSAEAKAQAGTDEEEGADGDPDRPVTSGTVPATTSVEREDRGAIGEDARADKATPKLMEASVGGGNAVSVKAVQVRGWDPEQKQEFLATVKTHAQVRSGEDLENFARGILLTDENVEAVSSDEEEVEVRYRVPARFLGFFETGIPATVVARAEAETEGRVQVRFPWYRFLFSVPEEVSSATLESELSAELAAEFSEEVGFTASRAARFYQAITAMLKVRNDAAMAAIQNIR